jgi:hypothetical protein
LLPLLRVTTHLSPEVFEPDRFEAQDGDSDQLRPARGLGLAVLCSAFLWGGLIWLAPNVFSLFWS